MLDHEKARTMWLGRGRANDAEYLQKWRGAPLTYFPEQDPQELDEHWTADRYEVILGRDANGALFKRAAQLTLLNSFYPPEVMVSVSDYGLAGRTVQPGDRVLQRIRVFQYRGLPVLEVLTLNEITQVTDEARRAGFTYTTTSAHSEIGEWSPMVEWRENGEVVLVINVLSRPRVGAPGFARRLARQMQLRAHRLSIENFRAQLFGVPWTAPEGEPALVASLLPLALLGAAATLLLVAVALMFGRKDKTAR